MTAIYQNLKLPFSPLNLLDDELTYHDLKQYLTNFQAWSVEQFKLNIDIEALVHMRSLFIDQLLTRLWQYYQIPAQVSSLFKRNRIALIAVGGYGRGELHPLSDIDILILSDQPLPSDVATQIEALVRLLWDIRLDVGHSVRTLKICLQEAKNDLTIMTNLIESRLVAGNAALLKSLRKRILNGKIWPSPQFYCAKVAEQKQRHQQYHSTSYNLEPDIKNSPGGLRDLQTIQWIAVRHFGGISVNEISQFNYLTNEELEELRNCRRYLWRLRFALHSVINRYDNRLLFDRQLAIAHLLGYEGQGNKPVEKMMHDYYRVARNITELNQMLLQLFKESILALNPKHKPVAIDDNFQLRDTLIDIKDNTLFIQHPEMMMQLFYIILITPKVSGIYSNTIRQLRSARRKQTTLLSDNPQTRQLFLTIIKHPQAITKVLLPMHQFGILAAYLPGWKRIVGMMQFDLFHAYTVDEHTIRLLIEIANFKTPEGIKKHPNSSHIYEKLANPELLIIAALYHDIGKGKNHDHCELGAQLVESFCKLHDLNDKDTQLIVWLVRYHLLMSVTAQSRDLQDPAVIREFAGQVKNKQRLQYLLCLTVADVCATNNTLWNSWKQSLLRQLYFATERSFDLGIHQIPQPRSVARTNKQQALRILLARGQNEDQLKHFWKDYPFEYFLRYSPAQIAWHATHLLIRHDPLEPLVLINPEPMFGGTEIFVYSPDIPYLFARVCNELSKKNLNIHEALIITNKKQFALDTFIVLEPNGQQLAVDHYHDITHSIAHALQQKNYRRTKIKFLSSRFKHFMVPTQINFLATQSGRRTYMELVALDRPGLLACLGEVFATLELSLHSAKIVTLGEHVEDLFILTDKNGQALDDTSCDKLKELVLSSIEAMH